MSKVYNIDGVIHSGTEPLFTPDSRSYRYGDGFFESMKMAHGAVLHIDKHMSRIHKSALLLKFTLPENFDSVELGNRIRETAASQSIEHARVRCTLLRESDGLYTPIANNARIIIEITKTDQALYDYNATGLNLGSYSEMTKNANFISTLKTTSSLLYVMAGIHAKEHGFDECVIFNENGRIAESISSNIFTVSGEFINTPPLSEYCVDGVMRKVVIQLAQAYGYTVLEQPISEITLNTADEIFLTSATRGIRWVGEYKGKRYRNTVSRILSDRLNPQQTLL
jgi:branched-subunit amino acid aminotransferase/4-amino-4-deoxychorismate lyase